MATQTMYKIIFNGVVLPNVYFSYSDATNAYKAMKESGMSGFGRVVLYDNETDELL